ncbi:MAG: hypothetical protein ACTSRE_14250 [Promethearchaeota archaeon]
MAQSPIAVTAGILSIASAAFIFFICILILFRYIKRKKINTLYLAISILFWGLGCIFASNIYLLAETNLTWVIWCQKLVYVCVFLGIMFTYQFSQGIFLQNKKMIMLIYWAIGLIVIILTLALPSVEIGVFPDGSNYPLLTIKIAFSILVVVYLLPTIISVIVKALQTANKIEDRGYKFGFRVISVGQFMIIFTFIVDTIATIVIDNIQLYSVMLYLTWIFPLIGVVCYYIGWILPNWVKKIMKIDV